jgi:hypothetical protein
MRKTKSIIAMMAGALVFSCVLSCDDENGKMESSKQFSAKGKAGSTSAPNRSGSSVFDSSVGDPIDLTLAKKWTANYKNTIEKPDQRVSHYFGFEIIQEILSQESCIGIRMYYALDDNGDRQLLLVGVDSTGEDILPASGGKTNDGGGIIGDASFPCPNTCPENGL